MVASPFASISIGISILFVVNPVTASPFNVIFSMFNCSGTSSFITNPFFILCTKLDVPLLNPAGINDVPTTDCSFPPSSLGSICFSSYICVVLYVSEYSSNSIIAVVL